MRHAKFFVATLPLFFTLLTAPFLHTHVRALDNRAIQSSESRIAIIHAHFPEEKGASASENGCPSDLDHSLNEPKPFVLVALLAPQSPTVFLEMGTWAAILPGFMFPLIAPLERVNLTAAPAIHDPPGLRRISFRAPPSGYLI
jgi:hypothetical protein